MGGEVLLSLEGTAQGDPLAMAMYALASVPLIERVSTSDASQVWFADDATSGGRLAAMRQWWDKLLLHGPAYGYDVNALKSWLVVKPDRISAAHEIFADTGVNVTATGTRHLGAVLGTPTFVEQYVREKVCTWSLEVTRLAGIARTEPHAAYCAFTHGLAGQRTYLCRTVPAIAPLLQPLEDTIQSDFLPALLGRCAPGPLERRLFALPAQLGGLGLINPTQLIDQHDASVEITAPLVALIVQQQSHLGDVTVSQQAAKRAVLAKRRANLLRTAASLHQQLSPSLQRAVQLATERGASTWLSALPLTAHGFDLSKSSFRDAVCIRYGWTPPMLPALCHCGASFTVAHALSCPTGGFPTVRHNELRDLCATLLTEVCPDVAVEPSLQPLTGEHLPTATATHADGARLDIVVSGFWDGRFERTFFDVRVFNPNVFSNSTSQLVCLLHPSSRLSSFAFFFLRLP